MITRRGLLVGSGASLVAPLPTVRPALAALPVPASGRLAFKVMRGGTQIGSHELTFTPAGDKLTVAIEVTLSVKFGPITLYRYAHHATEVWQGDQVQSLESESDDNGTPHGIRAQRMGDGLHVQGTRAQPYIAPADALPSSHWNRKVLDGAWINTQDGRLMRPAITPLGPGEVDTAAGPVQVERFTVHEASFELDLETWYDSTPSWCGVGFKGGDGSQVRYYRL